MKKLNIIILTIILSITTVFSYGMAGSYINKTEFAYNAKSSYNKANNDYTIIVGNLHIIMKATDSGRIEQEFFIKRDNTAFTSQEIKIIASKYSDNDWRVLDKSKPNEIETEDIKLFISSDRKILTFVEK